MNAHEHPPKIRDNGARIRGGPALPGEGAETIPAACDLVLRAEADGINLFLRSLDMDLEDAQAAVEAVMQVQLQRGRYDLALQAAREFETASNGR